MNTATYPHAPGFKTEHPETSKRAAKKVASRAAVLRDLCLVVFDTGTGEFTADEVADRIKESVLSIRPRISELVAEGLLEDSGKRRKNSSGHSAAVWRKPVPKTPPPVLKQVSLFTQL